MNQRFFISDLHFSHANILKYDNRPYSDIVEHDKVLIERWNSVVTDEDEVYMLGDIGWCNPNKMAEILKQLKGKKTLIIGNHDKEYIKKSYIKELFVEIVPYKELYLDKKTLLSLSHYPIQFFNKHTHGGYHFYGHVHNSFEENMVQHWKRETEELYNVKLNMINVGAMMPWINYYPRTFEEIIEYL